MTLARETGLPLPPTAGKVPPVANPHDHPTALKDLQDSIYREKVLRARAMTPEERFNSGFEIPAKRFKECWKAPWGNWAPAT